MAKVLKVLLLFDWPCAPPANQDYSEYLRNDEFKSENQIATALKELGHEPRFFGLHDDIEPLVEELKANKPDIVFNLVESFKNDRVYEPNIPALLELLGVKYTGSDPHALHLCKDKGLTKKILTFHSINVPQFVVSKRSQPITKLENFDFPALVKPLGLEASEGISQMSLVENGKDCTERIRFIHDRFESDVIIEQFINGREVYVSILGNEKLSVFPPRELFFKHAPEDEPRFATYKAKWDKNYRKKWGIQNGDAKAIPDKVLEHTNDICKKIYRLFQIRGFGRIDLRVTPENQVFFIEANPNPSLCKDEDFAKSAEAAGLEYNQLIDKIVSLAA